ncbi:MAG: DUF86 domain-containing protein [Candidatus Lokiarchaeota archaeon]|nr:DUF86 domain-containing protein [Candidatus Lokiarchaeota archaeon]
MQDDPSRLFHIRDAIAEILDLSDSVSRIDLDSNKMLQYSLIYLLGVVGEAANGLSKQFQIDHPEISWRDIISIRHRLIHGYFDVDLDIIWETVTRDIPILKNQISEILNGFNSDFI